MALLLIIAAMLFSMPIVAQAEEIAYQIVGTNYYDIWRHADGTTWTSNGKPGDTVSFSWRVNIPKRVLENYKITRLETTKSVNEPFFNAAGNYSWMNWSQYRDNYVYHSPDKINSIDATVNSNSIDMSASIVLEPVDNAVDLRDPANRSIYDPKGKGPAFAADTQGWRWYVPYGLTVYGNPKNNADLSVDLLTVNVTEVKPGQSYSGRVKYKLNNAAGKSVQATVSLEHNGYSISSVDGKNITLSPGGTKSFSFNFTGQSSDSLITAEISPKNDADPTNNSKSIAIVVQPVINQPQNGDLTFQAYSQAGRDQFGNYHRSERRPANTSKWTDTVTATLTPQAPSAPKGSIDWWKITEAELTYPKKSSDFTFGTPYGPRGSKTVNMSLNGHTAEVDFIEDWAMDGAQIYSPIEGKVMAKYPKTYSIQADYKIKYQYTYTYWKRVRTYDWEQDDDGDWYKDYYYTWVQRTKTKTDSFQGNTSGDLLVNGSGVNSLAQ